MEFSQASCHNVGDSMNFVAQSQHLIGVVAPGRSSAADMVLDIAPGKIFKATVRTVGVEIRPRAMPMITWLITGRCTAQFEELSVSPRHQAENQGDHWQNRSRVGVTATAPHVLGEISCGNRGRVDLSL